VDELAMVEEIRQLKARYFRLLDTKRWDEWRALFTPDAWFSSPRMDGGSETLDVFVPKVAAGLARWRTAHHGHLPEIRLTGEGTAEGSWALNDYLIDDGDKGPRSVRGYGYYDETYRLTDEGWRIASLRLRYLQLEAARGDEVPASQGFTSLSPDWLPAPEPHDAAALADIEAIKRLKARYFRMLDAKRWDDYRRVFTRDARFDVGDMGGSDGDAFVATVAQTLAGATTAHHGHTPEIRRLADGRARGIWVLNDYVEFPSLAERSGIRGYGHYEEEYAREEGAWRIASLRLSYLWLDQLSGRPLERREGPSPVAVDDDVEVLLPPERLADVAEIERLKARSYRLVDERDWPAWRRLHTDDASIDGVPVDRFPAAAGDRATVHQAHMPEISFTSDVEAHGVWADFRYRPAAAEAEASHDYGYSHDRYRKDAGGWRIAGVDHTYLRRDRLTAEQVPRPFDVAESAYR
jgi:3-phenylpropionate/cinnamic acid dioxygenase small subunit